MKGNPAKCYKCGSDKECKPLFLDNETKITEIGVICESCRIELSQIGYDAFILKTLQVPV